LKPALRLALRLHEISNKSPYSLLFAAKGKSGASFGFMQGDLAARQPVVTSTFRKALAAAGMPAADIAALQKRLSVHLVANPLSPAETSAVNAALLASRKRVDAMDEAILTTVYAGLDRCVAAAASAHRTISPDALLYMALWINMSGPPTKLLTWLRGGDPALRKPVPPAQETIGTDDVEVYLQATDYYVENPINFHHMVQCATAGEVMLDHMVATAAQPADVAGVA
jgi:hypothetical protein